MVTRTWFLKRIARANFISLFLRLYIRSFNMGVTAVYIREAFMVLSLESLSEEKSIVL